MSATFRVQDGFELPTRRAYVLRGQVLRGEVLRGMFLGIPLNDSVLMSAPVAAVESVEGSEEDSAIGLLFHCQDEIDRAMWRGFTSPGEELTLTDDDPAA